MSIYITDIMYAAIAFPFVAFALTLPYVIYQYRKLGSVPWFYTLLTFSFIFYLMCAYFLVLLPLPSDRSIVVPGAEYPHLIPLGSFSDLLPVLAEDAPLRQKLMDIVTCSCIYQYLFNILLLVPLGMYLRYYFNRPLWQTVAIGFCVSLSFELLQLTGICGLYEHPYRFFDIDDLCANTLGAFIGYKITGPIMSVLPKSVDIEEKARRAGQRASATRRIFSLVIDISFVELATPFVMITAELLMKRFGFPVDDMTWGIASSVVSPLLLLTAFALIPALLEGRTLGQLILRLYTAREDGSRAPWYLCTARYLTLFALFMTPFILIFGVLSAIESVGAENSVLFGFISENLVPICVIWAILVAAWCASIAARMFMAWRSKSSFMLVSDAITHTRVLAKKPGSKDKPKYRNDNTTSVISEKFPIDADEDIPQAA